MLSQEIVTMLHVAHSSCHLFLVSSYSEWQRRGFFYSSFNWWHIDPCLFSGVCGTVAVVDGTYTYHHYMQDNFNDDVSHKENIYSDIQQETESLSL